MSDTAFLTLYSRIVDGIHYKKHLSTGGTSCFRQSVESPNVCQTEHWIFNYSKRERTLPTGHYSSPSIRPQKTQSQGNPPPPQELPSLSSAPIFLCCPWHGTCPTLLSVWSQEGSTFSPSLSLHCHPTHPVVSHPAGRSTTATWQKQPTFPKQAVHTEFNCQQMYEHRSRKCNNTCGYSTNKAHLLSFSSFRFFRNMSTFL